MRHCQRCAKATTAPRPAQAGNYSIPRPGSRATLLVVAISTLRTTPIYRTRWMQHRARPRPITTRLAHAPGAACAAPILLARWRKAPRLRAWPHFCSSTRQSAADNSRWLGLRLGLIWLAWRQAWRLLTPTVDLGRLVNPARSRPGQRRATPWEWPRP